MKKGFTLIELLGVIILLGVIGLIAYPIVNNSIKESKEQAYLETIRNIEEAAYRYSIEQSLNDDGKYHTISITEIQNRGLLKDSEIVNPITNQVLSGCVVYKWKEATKQYEFKYDEECNVPVEKPTIAIGASTVTSNNNGWYKEDFYVEINGTGTSYQYCVDIQECNPTTVVNSSSGNVLISSESSSNYVCVQAMNGEVTSEVVCSSPYKLDKTSPSIEGVNDVTIQKGNSIDLSNGVSYNDTLSGLEGSISISPSTVDTSKAGTTEVTYKVVDKAGNERSIVRKVIVDADGPLITYTVQGSPINSNGWSKSDFYVKGSITDQSGLGIRSAKWCSSTSGACTPIADLNGTELNSLISSESNNNRICIQATDNNNKTSEIICSDTYRLDKTVPIAGTASFSGTVGSNSWYTSNVTVNVTNGSDSLSGHLSTVSNVSSITSNTTGTTITITTTDLAGNSASRSYTIKVDKNAPTLTAKSGDFIITQGDSIVISNYFNGPSYSISGGTLSCSPTSTSGLSLGTHSIRCTATGGNGLVTNAEKQITIMAPQPYKDSSGANRPLLLTNMVPIKHNGTNWVYADIYSEWYNYRNKEWANAVVLKSGVTKTVGQTITEDDIALWYVWIPRYQYVIFNAHNESIPMQSIYVTFESGTANTGTVTCTDKVSGSGSSSETCTDYTDRAGLTNGTSTYTHPAFTFGGKELTGFWVGKFENSTTDSTCLSNTTTTNCNKNTHKIEIKPNVHSLRSVTVSNFFTSIQNIKTNYGISNGDSHMMKNMEWGAVAYLKQSKYGLGTTDIGININSNLITGCGEASKSTICNAYNTTEGMKASTTGNLYGIYDMSGGLLEYVMGNMVNSSNTFYTANSGFSNIPDAKYYDSYTYDVSNNSHGRGKLGDATKETLATFGNTTGGWTNDYSYFVSSASSWMVRGGVHSSGSNAGVFCFTVNSQKGGAHDSIGSRSVLVSE